MKNEFPGRIADIRAIEDCIRATKRYTEGVRTIRAKHPVQGEEFSSPVLSKHYEVYPRTDISWDMPAGTALDWLWREVPCINVKFRYDYKVNQASVSIQDGPAAIRELALGIPGISEALAKVIARQEETSYR